MRDEPRAVGMTLMAALAVGLLATRFGLRELMLGAVVTLACGSVASALAPDLAVLIAAQTLAGLGIGVSYSAAVAATAEWSTAENRVLALTLLGPPLAWSVGVPLVGLVGEVSWRLAWIVVPVSMAVVAIGLLLRRSMTPPARERSGLRLVLTQPGVKRWSIGEHLPSRAGQTRSSTWVRCSAPRSPGSSSLPRSHTSCLYADANELRRDDAQPRRESLAVLRRLARHARP
jgi:MFS family permease